MRRIRRGTRKRKRMRIKRIIRIRSRRVSRRSGKSRRRRRRRKRRWRRRTWVRRRKRRRRRRRRRRRVEDRGSRLKGRGFLRVAILRRSSSSSESPVVVGRRRRRVRWPWAALPYFLPIISPPVSSSFHPGLGLFSKTSRLEKTRGKTMQLRIMYSYSSLPSLNDLSTCATLASHSLNNYGRDHDG